MAATGMNDAAEPKWKRWLQPWKIAAALMAIFLIGQALLSWRDRDLIAALNNSPAFAQPEFPLEFSRKIQYDPLTFVGRGARAGFWDWTPEGLVLTPEGKRYFRMEEGKIVSESVAGLRRFSRFRERLSAAEGEQITFFYRWEELSPPAVALLYPPPKLGDEYLASAVVVRSGEQWEVQSVETRDFDEPLEHLQSIASGMPQ